MFFPHRINLMTCVRTSAASANSRLRPETASDNWRKRLPQRHNLKKAAEAVNMMCMPRGTKKHCSNWMKPGLCWTNSLLNVPRLSSGSMPVLQKQFWNHKQMQKRLTVQVPLWWTIPPPTRRPKASKSKTTLRT